MSRVYLSFPHAKFKRDDHRNVNNGEKIDPSEATLFTNRVAALLYLHLPLMLFQLTETMQVKRLHRSASETHSNRV